MQESIALGPFSAATDLECVVPFAKYLKIDSFAHAIMHTPLDLEILTPKPWGPARIGLNDVRICRCYQIATGQSQIKKL